MSELEDAPWAVKKQKGISIAPVPADDLPDAPWASEQPGIIEDSAKTIAPSLLRGTLAGITLPRTVSDLTGAGVNWAVNKAAPGTKAAELANRFHEADTGIGGAFPSYDQLKSETERDITGPLYEAKTGVGKGVQAGAEVLPSLLTGGPVAAAAKSIGAGIGSGTLGEAAHYFKDILPTWAEPVARGVGTLGGTFLPSLLRGRLTPKPITDPEHAAKIAALKAQNPDVLAKTTAGQYTNDLPLMTSEGRAPRFANQAEEQERVLTAEAMKYAGAKPGEVATPEVLRRLGGKDQGVPGIGEEIGTIRKANEINTTEFPVLKQELATIRRGFTRDVGKDNAKALSDVENEIALGAQNNPANASMRGGRYQYMRQVLQGKIDAGATGTDKEALVNFRDALDRAFHRSITPQESARLKELESQYVNFEAIAGRSNPKGKTTMNPAELRQAGSSHSGNKAANLNTDKLARLSDNASHVMQELPARSTEVPDWAHLVGSIGGALSHGGAAAGAAHASGGGVWPAIAAGLVGAGEGSLTGLFTAPHYMNVARDMAARLRAGPLAQKYYKNQRFMPGGPATTNDKATLARLLATEQALLPDQTK